MDKETRDRLEHEAADELASALAFIRLARDNLKRAKHRIGNLLHHELYGQYAARRLEILEPIETSIRRFRDELGHTIAEALTSDAGTMTYVADDD